MSQTISILDCSLAPLLWRLPMLNIKLPAKAKAVEEYAERIFSRPTFQAGLSDKETSHEIIKMTSQKPYLIRAVYEWLIDNGATPYLLVDTSFEGVIVPEAFINDSKIVLNIAPDAVSAL